METHLRWFGHIRRRPKEVLVRKNGSNDSMVKRVEVFQQKKKVEVDLGKH